MIYVLAKDFEQSEQIRRYCRYSIDEWLYIAHKTFNLQKREGRGRPIYFCGEFYQRRDWEELRRIAKERGFEVKMRELPPRREQ